MKIVEAEETLGTRLRYNCHIQASKSGGQLLNVFFVFSTDISPF